MTAWDVILEDSHGCATVIDTVFYDDDCDADYVRRGLIDHDGYPGDIQVRKASKIVSITVKGNVGQWQSIWSRG